MNAKSANIANTAINYSREFTIQCILLFRTAQEIIVELDIFFLP